MPRASVQSPRRPVSSSSRRSSSAPAGPRLTSNVGALLYHEPPAALRDHVRDNVRQMRAKARHQRSQREEAAAQEKPAFKLRQFENVPARLYQESRSRPSSAPASPRHSQSKLAGTPQKAAAGESSSTGWRVANGYGSLSSPESPPLLSTPVRNAAKTPQARLFCTPEKSPKHGAVARRACGQQQLSPARCEGSPRSEAYGSEDEACFDIGNFEKVAKQLKFLQGKDIPAKDAQGKPTRLQHHKMSPHAGPVSPLWPQGGHCGEAAQPPPPAGYRKMPDCERLQTLDTLNLKLIELDDRYRRLPLRIETEGQRQQQTMLRAKIAEAEKAINVFSRSAVLVEM